MNDMLGEPMETPDSKMDTELDARLSELILSPAGRPAADGVTDADIVSEVSVVRER